MNYLHGSAVDRRAFLQPLALSTAMFAKEVLLGQPAFAQDFPPVFVKETEEQRAHRIAARSLLRLANAIIAQVLRRLSRGNDHLHDTYSIERPWWETHGNHPPAFLLRCFYGSGLTA